LWRCAGVDIGKDEVVACVRVAGRGGNGRHKPTRTFASFTGELEAMADSPATSWRGLLLAVDNTEVHTGGDGGVG
jgi:hypothetical protein